MCGIVGYVGPREATAILVDGLKRLEYRGYDSAGICVWSPDGLELYKRKGKIRELAALVPAGAAAPAGTCGIGHTPGPPTAR